MNWCGGLVDGCGIPLLGAQGAAGGASLVVLVMRHGGHRGPPSTLSPADLVHPQSLSISLLSVHLKKTKEVTAHVTKIRYQKSGLQPKVFLMFIHLVC